jgi:hypothetical protein
MEEASFLFDPAPETYSAGGIFKMEDRLVQDILLD